MTLPDYWLPRPAMEWSPDEIAAVEKLYVQRVLPGAGVWIDDSLPVSKWAFLCWLTDEKGLLLHGSGSADIAEFQPRTPNDNSPDDFSKQTAVFAAGDGIWAMFYAILDRSRFHTHIMNGALRFELVPGELTAMHYYFSVNQEAMRQNPWREGVVYLMPRDGFEQQEPYDLAGRRVHEPHWARLTAVRPLAKVRVSPGDFPLMAQVRQHDEAYIRASVKRDPYGFPWLGED